MAHFEDLTPYIYGGGAVRENILNVGWLSIQKPFSTGEVSQESLQKLQALCSKPVNLYRGVHYCEFCPEPLFEKIEDRLVSKKIRDCPNGNGEIHVQGKDGVVYKAPVLVAHYVEVHKYLPPAEFIAAL